MSDSDEEENDFGGRPLVEWKKKNRKFDWLNAVIETLDDEQSRLLCANYLNKREKWQRRNQLQDILMKSMLMRKNTVLAENFDFDLKGQTEREGD